MDKMEMLCRAWIECDPNRGGKPGSGFHPDDDITLYGQDGEERPAKTWEWFRPRAEALEAYLTRHGYKVVRAE